MRSSFEDIVPSVNSGVELERTSDNRVICIQRAFGYRVNLNENAYNLIRLIDGKKTIGQLTKEFNRESGDSISSDTILDILDGDLKKTGIIDMGDGCKVKHSEPTYLRLRIDLISNRYSSYISMYFKYLFGENIFWPLFFVQSAIVYVLFILYSTNIYTQLEKLDIIDVIVIFLLMGAALFAHELGHISACDRYGARHGSVGFGFYLFTPVMYADVSDIWRLPKNQRLIVNMAGIYMGNYMALIAFSLFLYTNNLIFLYVFSLQSIEGLCNLNPLLKYDGYWMLSDMLRLPNMSKMALEKISSFSFHLLGTYNAKDWFLLIYGIISPMFILFFLTTVLFLNPDSVLYFPKDFIVFVYNIFVDIHNLNFLELANFSPYILFYYLVIKICKRYISN